MSQYTRIRTWCTAFAAAAVLFTASPAVARDHSDDTASRLEAARVLLESSAGALSSSQLTALTHTLSDALESAHFGFQTSALRLVIAYGDQVEFSHRTVIDVVRLYRDHPDDRVRRMAVVALGTMDDDWGMDFLQRSLRFEKAGPVKHTIAAVLAEDRAKVG
jgi:hypothetical protein